MQSLSTLNTQQVRIQGLVPSGNRVKYNATPFQSNSCIKKQMHQPSRQSSSTMAYSRSSSQFSSSNLTRSRSPSPSQIGQVRMKSFSSNSSAFQGKNVQPSGISTPKFKQRAINLNVSAGGKNSDFQGAGKPVNDSNKAQEQRIQGMSDKANQKSEFNQKSTKNDPKMIKQMKKQKKEEAYSSYKDKMQKYFKTRTGLSIPENSHPEAGLQFQISNLDETYTNMQLDYMDKVIAEFDIDLINEAKSRKELRKIFLEILDHTNYGQIQDIMNENYDFHASMQDIMNDVDGSGTSKQKDKLFNKIETIEEDEKNLRAHLQYLANTTLTTDTDPWTEMNQFSSIKQIMTGWGSKIEVKMDASEKDSKTWIQERQMSVQDKQFTKRYLKFLKEDIQKQEIEDLIHDLNHRCKYKNNLLSGNNKLSDFYVNPLFKYNGIHEGFDHQISAIDKSQIHTQRKKEQEGDDTDKFDEFLAQPYRKPNHDFLELTKTNKNKQSQSEPQDKKKGSTTKTIDFTDFADLVAQIKNREVKPEKQETIMYTGKLYRRKQPFGWGSELEIIYDSEHGHVKKVKRVMTKKDKAYMKNYLEFLECHIYKLNKEADSEEKEIDHEDVPRDIEWRDEQSAKIADRIRRHYDWLDKYLDKDLEGIFPQASQSQIQDLKADYQNIYEPMVKKLEQAKEMKSKATSEFTLDNNELLAATLQHNEFFAKDKITMRTLVEQFTKVSESEKRKIYDLQNESTETEIYGQKLMNFCKKELFEKNKINQFELRLIYSLSIQWPLQFKM